MKNANCYSNYVHTVLIKGIVYIHQINLTTLWPDDFLIFLLTTNINLVCVIFLHWMNIIVNSMDRVWQCQVDRKICRISDLQKLTLHQTTFHIWTLLRENE